MSEQTPTQYPKNPGTNWEIRGHFWFKPSPLHHSDERTLIIDPFGRPVAVDRLSEAQSLCEKWNKYGGELVSETWTPAPPDAPDSHRGTYTVSVKGMPNLTRHFSGGWHADASAARYIIEMRNFIAEQRMASA